uniref:Putative ixodes 8-cys protein n=1 Tax=Ixodes ricinus TaxID=34613 RepID=A0A0K8R9J3_IXORI
MFKLKFFILFLLAGLCFGDSSGSETVEAESSNGEATNDAVELKTSATDEKQEESTGETSVSDGDAAAKEKNKKFQGALGLPSWITNATNFMNTLITKCHDPLPTWETISNKTINWEKCKYTCKHDSNEHEMPLPENTPCGHTKICQNGTCAQQPSIPEPLPSCR